MYVCREMSSGDDSGQDVAARAEIDGMVPEPPPGTSAREAGLPHMLHKLRCTPLPALYTATVEMIGTVLSLPASNYGLAETTLLALHRSRAGILRALWAIEGNPAMGKGEKLLKLLTTAYPYPHEEEYTAFVDELTLRALGLPLLAEVVVSVTDMIATRAADLWRSIVEAKTKALAAIAGTTRAQRTTIEARYQEAHECVGFHKIDLATTYDAFLAVQAELATPDVQFHLDALPPPNSTVVPMFTQQICSACYIGVTVMCDADAALDIGDSIDWRAVCHKLFAYRNGDISGLSYELSSFHPSDLEYETRKTELFCRLVGAISRVAVKASGNAVLEHLYELCSSTADVLLVLQKMQPAHATIARFSQDLATWEAHVTRTEGAHAVYEAILPTLPKPAAAPVLSEEDRLLDPRKILKHARSHVLATLEGWGGYDTSAQKLSPELIADVFDVYDVSRNGVIDRDEVAVLYKSLERFGVPKPAEQLQEFLDLHCRKGGLDLDAFAVLLCQLVRR